MKLCNILVLISAIAVLPASAFAGAKGIFGVDNRVEYSEATEAQRAIADSVVSLWNTRRLEASGDSYILKTSTLTDAIQRSKGKPLCAEERFRTQKIGAFCSGTLVGEDLVLTAGHCMPEESDCANTRFVFGFALQDGQEPSSVPASQVYSCSKMELAAFRSSAFSEEMLAVFEMLGLNPMRDLDYAVVRLDRKVSGRRPVGVSLSSELRAGTPLFVAGHPLGLPLKVADDASVLQISEDPADHYFTTNLDAFQGNSGSAVFNAATNKVAGILVRGIPDFQENPSGTCLQAARYSQNTSGIHVSRISAAILAAIPAGAPGVPEPVDPRPVTVSQPPAVRIAEADYESIATYLAELQERRMLEAVKGW